MKKTSDVNLKESINPVKAGGSESMYSLRAVYIQHSERQQLGLERRFFKYSEIQGEREKMAN